MKVIQPMNGRVRAPKPGSLLNSVLFLRFVKECEGKQKTGGGTKPERE